MKITTILMAFLLIPFSANAGKSLNCLVQKFEDDNFVMAREDEVTFKGVIESNKVLLIDEKGNVKLSDNYNGVDMEKTQVGIVSSFGDMVIISNPGKKIDALGNKIVSLVDQNSGIAIICAKQ